MRSAAPAAPSRGRRATHGSEQRAGDAGATRPAGFPPAGMAQASAMHFLVKLVLAAPASFFSAALASHAAIVLGASVSHFLTKLVLAAPASFLSVALASHAAVAPAPASASHFLTKLVLAAPASFFSTAWASQLLIAPPAI